jgi:hypothetical protein
MAMLADRFDLVIGVDTHKDSHTAALVSPTGAVLGSLTAATDGRGLRRLLRFGRAAAGDRRLWVLEGTGSYGAGLTTALLAAGETVAEIDRPRRPARRHGAKSDPLDAIRAAREALGREHLGIPRRGGVREALRVLFLAREAAVNERRQGLNRLHALVISAPDELRATLRGLSADQLVRRCSGLREHDRQSVELRATRRALTLVAQRVLVATAQATSLEADLRTLVEAQAPALLGEPGVGAIGAAWLLVVWSHPGRIRSEAAFAFLGGAAPLPASSGQTIRHRLNRGGDRILNRTLHTIVVSRLRYDPTTQVYAARRRAEGLSDAEIRRCLKRFVARRLFRLMEHQIEA